MEIILMVVALIEFIIIDILRNKIHENDEYMNYQQKQNEYLEEENKNLMIVIEESDKQIKELRKKIKENEKNRI